MSRTCANHPEARASAHCSKCKKAVCARCTVTMPTGVFCSMECSLGMDAAKREKALFAGVKPSAWATVGIILFLIFGLLIGYHFLAENVKHDKLGPKMRKVDVIGILLRAIPGAAQRRG